MLQSRNSYSEYVTCIPSKLQQGTTLPHDEHVARNETNAAVVHKAAELWPSQWDTSSAVWPCFDRLSTAAGALGVGQ
jgi:hypothetical protein